VDKLSDESRWWLWVVAHGWVLALQVLVGGNKRMAVAAKMVAHAFEAMLADGHT